MEIKKWVKKIEALIYSEVWSVIYEDGTTGTVELDPLTGEILGSWRDKQ